MEPRLVNARTATRCEDEKMISRAVVFRRQVVQVPCITTGLSRSSGGHNECIQSVDLAPPCTFRACTSHLWLTVISTVMCSSPGRKKSVRNADSVAQGTRRNNVPKPDLAGGVVISSGAVLRDLRDFEALKIGKQLE